MFLYSRIIILTLSYTGYILPIFQCKYYFVVQNEVKHDKAKDACTLRGIGWRPNGVVAKQCDPYNLATMPFNKKWNDKFIWIDKVTPSCSPRNCLALSVNSSETRNVTLVCIPCDGENLVMCESDNKPSSQYVIVNIVHNPNDPICHLDWVRAGKNELLVVMERMPFKFATMYCVARLSGTGLMDITYARSNISFLHLAPAPFYWISTPVPGNSSYAHRMLVNGGVGVNISNLWSESICQREYHAPSSQFIKTSTKPLSTTASRSSTLPTPTNAASTTAKSSSTLSTTPSTTSRTPTTPTTSSTTSTTTSMPSTTPSTPTTTPSTPTTTPTTPTTPSTTSTRTSMPSTTPSTPTTTPTTPTKTPSTTSTTTSTTSIIQSTTSTTTSKPSSTPSSTSATLFTTSTTLFTPSTSPSASSSTSSTPLTTPSSTLATLFTNSETLFPPLTSLSTSSTTTSAPSTTLSATSRTPPTPSTSRSLPSTTSTTIQTTRMHNISAQATATDDAKTTSSTATFQHISDLTTVAKTMGATSSPIRKITSSITSASATLPNTTKTASVSSTSTSHVMPLASQDIEWTRYRFSEYYVNFDKLAFEDSRRFCTEQLNATLVFFYTTGLYIRIVREGLLNVSSGSLWVASDSNSSDSTCFKVEVDNYDAVLYGLDIDCTERRGSICARAIQLNNTEDLISEVMKDPEFIQMIEGMTVKKNSTKKNLRRYISVRDKAAEQAGTAVSIVLIVSTFAFFLMCDIPRIKDAMQRKCKKKQVKEKERARRQSEA